jgi:hypothetical protein
LGTENPEDPMISSRERGNIKIERGMKKGRSFFHGLNRENVWEVKRPKKARVPTWMNNLGSTKGYGFSDGRKLLKHRIEAGEVFI